MLLKTFSEEATVVLDSILSLNKDEPTEVLNKHIGEIISKFEKELRQEMLTSQRADKIWRAKRREVSLFYEILYFLNKDKPEVNYDTFSKLKSGEILNNPQFVLLALMNGLIRLNPTEITYLINNNAVK